MEFKYPVAQAEGKEYTAEELYGLLADEDSGYYLLSANQFWHGGIHFSNSNFSHCVKDVPIQAIAEGIVIAYRINEKYLLIPDDEVVAILPEEAGYQYSSGFCLIKHQYKSPEKKPTTQESMDQWKDREIVLQSNRNARNIEGLELKADTDYMVSLKTGTKLEVVSVGNTVVDKYYFTQVKTQEALKGKTKANKEVDVPIGTILYLATFKADGRAETYKGTDNKQHDIFKENETPQKWQNRLVILKIATESYKDAQKTVLATLPAETKVQLLEPSNTTGSPTKAKLLYDVNVTPDSTPTTLKKDQELWINLFDDKGQVTQQNNKPIAEDTPTANQSQYNFTFYSLYMHLCAYNDYIAKPEEIAAKKQTFTIDADNLNVRETYRGDGGKAIGTISNGATVEAEINANNLKTKNNITDLKATIKSGTFTAKTGITTTVKGVDDEIWVPIKQGDKSFIKEAIPELPEPPKEMTRPSYWEGTVTAKVKKSDGLKIWKKLESDELKEPVGDLNIGNEFTFDSTQVKIITHNSKPTMVAECTPVGTLTFRKDGEQVDKFWTLVDKDSITREKVTPTSFNTIVPCNAKVTAGEALGYLGVFQTPSLVCEIVKKRQVHVEVFTPDPMMVDFLLNNPLGLKGGKQFIKLPAGTKLFASPTPTATPAGGVQPQQVANAPAGGVQPQQAANAPAGGVQPQQAANAPAGGVQPQQAANAPAGGVQPQQVANAPAGGVQYQQAPNAPAANIPPQANGQPAPANAAQQPTVQSRSTTPSYTLTRDHIFAIDDLTLEKDPDGTEWYQIGIEQHSGGVKKTATTPEVISQYEWKKLGFQEVKETNPSADGYLDPKKIPPIFQEIYNKIDTGGENGSDVSDGKLQQSELKVALIDQEIRDQWSKLIAYHPSEWKKDTAPLLARFKQLLTPPDGTPEDKKAEAEKLLEQETLRMNSLVFLGSDPVSSIPTSFHHFHPVTFIEYTDSGIWCEPIEYPQRTYYNSERVVRPQNGAFGWVRNGGARAHQGLDLFADIDTPCYACLDGEIVQFKNEGNASYGYVLVIKVRGEDLKAAKNSYKLEFPKEEISGNGFNLNTDYLYLRYCHLSSTAVKTSGKVKKGEHIAYTSDTGNASGVINPHLHFEIAMKISGNGTALTNRYNPAYFVNLQPIDTVTQTTVKDRRISER